MVTLTVELPDVLLKQLGSTDVKIFYDQDGQACEVLMNYETFQQITTLLQTLGNNNDQTYFWTESWQERIRQGESDVLSGRTQQATLDTLESALDWLDE